MHPTELSVVIMAYNEAESLRRVVEGVRASVSKLGVPFEILIVDDGSRDQTPEVARALCGENPRIIRCIRHEPNQGLGGVYRTGFDKASGKFVTFFPADGQFSPDSILDFYREASVRDLALGVAAPDPRAFAARFLSWAERLVYGVLFGGFPKFQGLFMLRRSLLDQIALESQGRGWGIVMEMILKVKSIGARITHVPHPIVPRQSGTSKIMNWRTIWANMRQVLLLRLMPWPSTDGSRRFHIAGSLALSLVFWSFIHFTQFSGFKGSDGANYATVARNMMEGKGMVSSVIQPGLIEIAKTSREGQSYVTQAPMWPWMLRGWFEIFDAGGSQAAILGYIFASLAALMAWWFAFMLTRNPAAGYVTQAALYLNPIFTGSVLAIYNVPLQAAALAAMALLFWRTPALGAAILFGILSVVGVLTRENTIFIFAGLVVAWMPWRKFQWQQWLNVSAAVGAAASICFLALKLEGYRKSLHIGEFGNPTMKAAFLYHTPGFDLGWYFIYNYAGLHIDPLRYFIDHPDLLVAKMAFQFQAYFLEQILPGLFGNYPWFLPIIWPALFLAAGFRPAMAVLAAMAAQAAVSLVSTLHLHYFVAYLPLIYALAIATLFSLLARLLATGRSWNAKTAALAFVCAYAVLPHALNAFDFLRGKELLRGEYNLNSPDETSLRKMILEGTPSGAVVATAYSPLMAWHTGRTIVQYSGHPNFRIQDNEMWRNIGAKVRIDYLLYSSPASESETTPVPPQFQLVDARQGEGGFRAWLYKNISE